MTTWVVVAIIGNCVSLVCSLALIIIILGRPK